MIKQIKKSKLIFTRNSHYKPCKIKLISNLDLKDQIMLTQDRAILIWSPRIANRIWKLIDQGQIT